MAERVIFRAPYYFQPPGRNPIEAEWGALFVPENRRSSQSRLISIPFVRFICTADRPGPPIFHLQGGPGISTLKYLDNFWSDPDSPPPVHLGDLLFIEQRGIGYARPALETPGRFNIPLDTPGSPEIYREVTHRHLQKSVEFWQGNGLDLNGYNVLEMAEDIDDLRRALGYSEIMLLGGSFGSHHGLAVMRTFGPAIRRAFLWSIEGPNHTIKLPSNIQLQLENLSGKFKAYDRDAQGSLHLLELLEGLLDKLDREPIVVEAVHPGTGEPCLVHIGKYDLQLTIANGLGSTPFLSKLPSWILAMINGDFHWLGERVLNECVNQELNLMYALTDYASGATAERKVQIAEQAQATLLGDAINEPFLQFDDL
ncbi:MAG: alpha/beta fold hydrolase, partial [Anaerolineales bacterium]|nr:alpha/beta fold hydrolase [Anaerolineales bacterium]